MKFLEKIGEFWNKLPKPLKVFCFIFVSYTLKFVGEQLGLIEDNAFAQYMVGIINIVLVLLEEFIPVAKKAIKK